MSHALICRCRGYPARQLVSRRREHFRETAGPGANRSLHDHGIGNHISPRWPPPNRCRCVTTSGSRASGSQRKGLVDDRDKLSCDRDGVGRPAGTCRMRPRGREQRSAKSWQNAVWGPAFRASRPAASAGSTCKATTASTLEGATLDHLRRAPTSFLRRLKDAAPGSRNGACRL